MRRPRGSEPLSRCLRSRPLRRSGPPDPTDSTFLAFSRRRRIIASRHLRKKRPKLGFDTFDQKPAWTKTKRPSSPYQRIATPPETTSAASMTPPTTPILISADDQVLRKSEIHCHPLTIRGVSPRPMITREMISRHIQNGPMALGTTTALA